MSRYDRLLGSATQGLLSMLKCPHKKTHCRPCPSVLPLRTTQVGCRRGSCPFQEPARCSAMPYLQPPAGGLSAQRELPFIDIVRLRPTSGPLDYVRLYRELPSGTPAHQDATSTSAVYCFESKVIRNAQFHIVKGHSSLGCLPPFEEPSGLPFRR